MPTLNKKTKLILIALAAFLLVLIIGGNIVAYRYKLIIQERLPVAVNDATGGLYHISVKNVSINILNRRIILKDVHLWPDSTVMAQKRRDSAAHENYFDVVIPRLRVSAIMWDKLTGGAGFSCGTFSVIKPVINIYKTDAALTINDTIKHTGGKDFEASTFVITDADISYHFKSGENTDLLRLSRCNLTLRDWEYTRMGMRNSDKFLMAEKGKIEIGKLTYSPISSSYNFSATSIKFNSTDNKLTANNIRMKLKMSQAEFLRTLAEQKEIYDIHMPAIELTGIDRKRLLEHKELHMSTVYLNHSKIEILLSRLLPENTKSKMGKFPNQLLQHLKLPVDVRNIKIHNGNVSYTEISNKTRKKASIHFENMNGNISNISNIPSSLKKDSTCVAKLDCKFNKFTDVSTLFHFSLTDPRGGFSANVQLEGLLSHQISAQTKAFSLIEIKSLNMRSLTMQISGNERAAKSNFTMLYNNLGIKILTDENNLRSDKKKKGFLTFIANNMILYSHNPMPGDSIRKVHTTVQRDSLKSFFNLVWKNIQQGVQETTIRDMEVIEWIRKNEKEKKINPDRQLKNAIRRDTRREKKRARRRGTDTASLSLPSKSYVTSLPEAKPHIV